jgi:hypothetical protein
MAAKAAREPVAVPLHRLSRPDPTFEERLALRLPRTVTLFRRALLRMRPGSRLRGMGLARAMAVAFASYERRDFESVPRLFYSPDVVLVTGRGRGEEVPLDLPSPARGIEGVIRWLEAWHEPFSSIRYEPIELLDAGDRLVITIEQVATGRASGVSVRERFSSAVRLERGLVVEQFVTWHREDALEAAGFAPSEDAAAVASSHSGYSQDREPTKEE